MTPANKIGARYAIVFGACLTQFTIIGLLFSYGLFFKIFEAEFGWSRTLMSSCSSLAFLMMGVLAIFGGRLNDRYGPRIVLSFTGVVYGLGYALISQISQPWHLFAIFGLFISLGMSTHDVVTLSTIARWFKMRRGAMTGFVKVGIAAGQMAIPPLAALLILTYGWRPAVIMLGLTASVVLLIAAMSMKKPPETQGQSGTAVPEDGLSFAEVRRTRIFWTMCAIQFTFFPTLTSIPLHIVVHGMDLGMSAAVAAGLVSTVGGASVLGRLAVGAFADQIGGKRSLILCFVPLIISLIALQFVESYWPLFGVIALYGFGHGGLFTVVSPTIAEYFGLRAHGAIFGAILFFGTLGGAGGPMMTGWVFDTTGSYAIAFGILAALAGLGLALVLTLPAARQTGTV